MSSTRALSTAVNVPARNNFHAFGSDEYRDDGVIFSKPFLPARDCSSGCDLNQRMDVDARRVQSLVRVRLPARLYCVRGTHSRPFF